MWKWYKFPIVSVEQFPACNTAHFWEIIRIGPFLYRVWLVLPNNKYLVVRSH